MYDVNDFIKLMKRTAVEAVNSSKPANLVFGTVINLDPLQIRVDSKLILNKAQLVLSRNVTEHYIEMTVDHTTEEYKHTHNSVDEDTHKHDYKGRKKFLVHNALILGERVILGQVAGGQKYIVLDRIGVM